MAVVLVFLFYFALFFIDIWTNHGNTSIVPDVRNMTYKEAVSKLKKDGLDIEIADSIYDTKLAPGMVKEVWPRPGARVKPGRTVYLTINSFQPQQVTVTMPLTGVSSRQAMTYLESLNVRNIRVVYVPSNFPDLVEGAKYKGKSIKPGMQIPVNAEVVLEVGNMAPGIRQRPTETVADSGIDDDYVAPEPETVSPESEPTAPAPEPEPKPEHKSEPTPVPSTPTPVADPDVFD